MVDVGKLEIAGTLNTKDIDKGFKKIEQGYSQVAGKTKGFNADMIRIGSSVGKATLAFGGMAVAASTAILGIAKDAPQVAPAMAEMQLAMMDLKFTLGEELSPTFERASDMFQDLVNTFKESGAGEFTNSFFLGVLNFFEGLGNTIGWVIDQGEKFVNFFQGQGWKTKEELGEEPDIEKQQKTAETLGTATAAAVTALGTIWAGTKIAKLFSKIGGSISKMFGGGGGGGAAGGVTGIPTTIPIFALFNPTNPFSSYSFARREENIGYNFDNYLKNL